MPKRRRRTGGPWSEPSPTAGTTTVAIERGKITRARAPRGQGKAFGETRHLSILGKGDEQITVTDTLLNRCTHAVMTVMGNADVPYDTVKTQIALGLGIGL